MKEEGCAAREAAKATKKKEKVEQAAEKVRQQEARNAAKAIQLPQKSKGKASRPPTQKNKRQKRVVDAVASGEGTKDNSSLSSCHHPPAVAASTFQKDLSRPNWSEILQKYSTPKSRDKSNCVWLQSLILR
ncbi:hypothetical protein GQ43DRAFT_486559 [Delitschia confertaspora ATCC 74209]|uniref:Uncharacterized protein n=1 Tax=Delitschia confertaspora ATCC 74209 TaxID=1513339 RepID=A0A9P4JTM1_9PLEO|nr:hypothetical protein GQ43DRAFT_486559 [Delitschia confertaspora ATCC 74209]